MCFSMCIVQIQCCMYGKCIPYTVEIESESNAFCLSPVESNQIVKIYLNHELNHFIESLLDSVIDFRQFSWMRCRFGDCYSVCSLLSCSWCVGSVTGCRAPADQ